MMSTKHRREKRHYVAPAEPIFYENPKLTAHKAYIEKMKPLRRQLRTEAYAKQLAKRAERKANGFVRYGELAA